MKRKFVVHGIRFTALFMIVLHTFRRWMVTVKKSKLFFLIVIYVQFLLFHDKIIQYPMVLTAYITFRVCICLLYYYFVILKMLTQGFLEYLLKNSHSAVHTWLCLVVVKNFPVS